MLLLNCHAILSHLQGKTAEGTESKGAKVRRQIEIQSVCEWDLDRKRVIETLCRRMSQGKLTQLFRIGPYLVRPLAKISIEKPSGSVITYRVGPNNANLTSITLRSDVMFVLIQIVNIQQSYLNMDVFRFINLYYRYCHTTVFITAFSRIDLA